MMTPECDYDESVEAWRECVTAKHEREQGRMVAAAAHGYWLDEEPTVEEMRKQIANTIITVPEDPVNQPSHYTHLPVECIDVTEHFGFCLGNVIKYVWRADFKGKPLEDLKKARFYLDREIAKRERLGG